LESLSCPETSTYVSQESGPTGQPTTLNGLSDENDTFKGQCNTKEEGLSAVAAATAAAAAISTRPKKKTKENIANLKKKYRSLSAKKSTLENQVQELRGELGQLRTQTLQHQQCLCGIAQYNINQAQKVACGLLRRRLNTKYSTAGLS
jgi:septal ring factor EnvC (AmiA/AmiB activator)